MSVLTDIWRQLVRRRLWPVAVLLVAALAALPTLLAKEPEVTQPVPPAVAVTEADATLSEAPIVTASEVSTRRPGRKVLGAERDIFASTAKERKTAKKDTAKDAGTQDEQPSEEPASDGSDSDGKSGSGGAAPAPAAPPAEPQPKAKTYPLYSLRMRFSSGEQSTKGYLPVRAALPSADNPMLIYLGLLDDRKTAVFMLDSRVQAVGDGECRPSPESCETVRMRVGDTMFFDVLGDDGQTVTAQFQIDLLAIHKKQTTDAAKAARSSGLAEVSSASKVRGVASGLGGSTLRRLGVVGRTG